MDPSISNENALPELPSSPTKADTLPALPPASTNGLKRPPPTLLPAFEPSSSPGFSRSSAKRFRGRSPTRNNAPSKYPTPVPTSATGILSSSPPRPGLQRTASAVSERAPLQTLPSIVLPENGEDILMGRSSNSSHYQLSANRLISRVHVRARYISSPTSLESNKIEIKCEGWNGIKLHCQGRTWELAKGDSFTSETEFADVMLDVQDARVIIQWPRTTRRGDLSTDDEWNSSDGEQEQRNAVRVQDIPSSPMRIGQPMRSPVSPTPGGRRVSGSRNAGGLFGSNDDVAGPVKVYEDEPEEGELETQLEPQVEASFMTQIDSQPLGLDATAGNSQSSSDLSEPENDPDEENDPIIHSFGPFGADLSSRMAAFTAGGGASSVEAPKEHRSQASQARARGRPAQRKGSPDPEPRSRSRSTPEADPTPVVNHVINQLAYSRVASTPLSTLLSNLPAELKGDKGDSESSQENKGLGKADLRRMLEGSKCIGEVKREGKDAAGKPLESEFYYVPEGDKDDDRKKAVLSGLGRVGLRNCRKSHKQYYWKKPKTP